jgi:hypothetical protein
MKSLSSAAAVCVVAGACIVATAAPAAAGGTLTISNTRTSSGLVEAGSVYDYSPSVMLDGKYRMWWCGADGTFGPGDRILYATSSSLNGPFKAPNGAAYNVVFSPTGSSTGFDGLHTCDPSVVRVNGVYYMYYSGLGKAAGAMTDIGLATSTDGITWTRANHGNPIIVPAQKQNTGNQYGAGQPTVSYYKGQFYMAYTDTTGAVSGSINSGARGAGQYVLRSADPTFQTGVQERTASGFQSMTSANHTEYSIASYFSVDMQFSDALNVWIVAHSDGNVSHVNFYAPDFTPNAFQQIKMPLSVIEGPGLVSTPDKHSVAPANGVCGTVSLDVINATSTNAVGNPNSLKHEGLDVSAGQSCSSMAAGQVAAIYNGYAIQVAGLPLTLDVAGVRLQSASVPPIQDLTKNFITTTSTVFYAIPYGASLQVGATVVGATGRPAAFLLDNNTRWGISSIKIITDNKSSITTIPVSQYDSYGSGPSLYLVQ